MKIDTCKIFLEGSFAKINTLEKELKNYNRKSRIIMCKHKYAKIPAKYVYESDL